MEISQPNLTVIGRVASGQGPIKSRLCTKCTDLNISRVNGGLFLKGAILPHAVGRPIAK